MPPRQPFVCIEESLKVLAFIFLCYFPCRMTLLAVFWGNLLTLGSLLYLPQWEVVQVHCLFGTGEGLRVAFIVWLFVSRDGGPLHLLTEAPWPHKGKSNQFTACLVDSFLFRNLTVTERKTNEQAHTTVSSVWSRFLSDKEFFSKCNFENGDNISNLEWDTETNHSGTGARMATNANNSFVKELGRTLSWQ